MVYKALTIAGSDSGGGAGIQADLKTFQELGVFGMSALTAITAQNTLGVQGIYPVPVEGIVEQIRSVASDLRPNAVKLGMLFNEEIITAVARELTAFQLTNIVADPVMVAKGGAPLLKPEAVEAFKQHILPLATVLTPNMPEAEVLTGMTIVTVADQEEAARKLVDLGAKVVVVKGGHAESDTLVDVVYDGIEFTHLTAKRFATKHTHGTGCTFAAAITAEVAKGQPLQKAIQVAKQFIAAAIEHELAIGSGHGPTNHWAYNRVHV